MVNKPERLCREDALRKAELQRRTMIVSDGYRSVANIISSRILTIPETGPGIRHIQAPNSPDGQDEQRLVLSHRHQTSRGMDQSGYPDPSIPRAWSWRNERQFERPMPLSADSLSTTLMASRLRSHPMTRQNQTTEIGASLRGHSIVSDLPEVLYAHLDTGFFFECYTSHRGSYISYELYHQIRPRPEIVPHTLHERLRFNGESYVNLGFATFRMKMTAPDGEDGKQIDMMVTACVVPDLYPDMFLGSDGRLEPLSLSC